MITIAQIADVLSSSRVRVRIPSIHDVQQQSKVQLKELPIANVCTLPNQDMNFKVGDHVFVSTDDYVEKDPVVLGYLHRSDISNLPTGKYEDLTIRSTLNLPSPEYVVFESGGNETNLYEMLSEMSLLKKQVIELSQTIEELKKSSVSSATPSYNLSSSYYTSIVANGKDATNLMIWKFLMKTIGNPIGVAAIMGNMERESSMRSNNLQHTSETSLGQSDETYTKGVDSGMYDNFVHDRAGYGLVQWTSWDRKQGLYHFSKILNLSISDLGLQLSYLMWELETKYRNSLDAVTNTSVSNIDEAISAATYAFWADYERSAGYKQERADHAKKFYYKFNSV